MKQQALRLLLTVTGRETLQKLQKAFINRSIRQKKKKKRNDQRGVIIVFYTKSFFLDSLNVIVMGKEGIGKCWIVLYYFLFVVPKLVAYQG